MNAAYIIEPEGGLPTVDSVIDAIMAWASAEGKKVSFVAYEPMLVDVDGQRFVLRNLIRREHFSVRRQSTVSWPG